MRMHMRAYGIQGWGLNPLSTARTSTPKTVRFGTPNGTGTGRAARRRSDRRAPDQNRTLHAASACDVAIARTGPGTVATLRSHAQAPLSLARAAAKAARSTATGQPGRPAEASFGRPLHLSAVRRRAADLLEALQIPHTQCSVDRGTGHKKLRRVHGQGRYGR